MRAVLAAMEGAPADLMPIITQAMTIGVSSNPGTGSGTEDDPIIVTIPDDVLSRLEQLGRVSGFGRLVLPDGSFGPVRFIDSSGP